MENLREETSGSGASGGVIPPLEALRAIRGMLKGTDCLAKAKRAGFDTDTCNTPQKCLMTMLRTHRMLILQNLNLQSEESWGRAFIWPMNLLTLKDIYAAKKEKTSRFGPKGDFGTGVGFCRYLCAAN